jgi:hypothetical protein
LLSLAIIDLDMILELAHGQRRIAQLAEEARSVLQNGADLTQRLLTFARRQRLEARLVDINAMVAATGELRASSPRSARDGVTGKREAWVDLTQLQNALEPGVQRTRRHARATPPRSGATRRRNG